MDGAAAGPLEPGRLAAAAARVEAWLETGNPVAHAALQPGAAADSVVAAFASDRCVPPQELVDLYGWRNGMRADTDVPLLWYHRFMSVQDALAARRTYRNPVLHPITPLGSSWIPVFEFYGEYYFTRCVDAPGAGAAAVWHWSGEEPEVRLVFRSLSAMLETAAEWYESGAVRVGDAVTGALVEDLRRVHAIYTARNPGLTFPYAVPPS